MSDDDEQADKEAFERAMRGVEPLRRRPRSAPARPSKSTVPVKKPSPPSLDVSGPVQASLSEVSPVPPEQILSKRGGALSHQQWRRFCRGQLPIEARLDIHGLTLVEAQPCLQRFIIHQQQSGHRCVLIMHGKGHGLLKGLTQQWLKAQSSVLAYHSAVPADGGTGAVYVYLKYR